MMKGRLKGYNVESAAGRTGKPDKSERDMYAVLLPFDEPTASRAGQFRCGRL